MRGLVFRATIVPWAQRPLEVLRGAVEVGHLDVRPPQLHRRMGVADAGGQQAVLVRELYGLPVVGIQAVARVEYLDDVGVRQDLFDPLRRDDGAAETVVGMGYGYKPPLLLDQLRRRQRRESPGNSLLQEEPCYLAVRRLDLLADYNRDGAILFTSFAPSIML